jgi:hypothetical protein
VGGGPELLELDPAMPVAATTAPVSSEAATAAIRARLIDLSS